MPAMEPLCQLIGINPFTLSKEENLILEAELFTRICAQLKEIFRAQYKDFFRLYKFNAEMENAMIESNFVRSVINDILATKAYTLSGIALYTQTPEEVIYEVATGSTALATLALPRKIIEIHRSVRMELYREVMKKNRIEDGVVL